MTTPPLTLDEAAEYIDVDGRIRATVAALDAARAELAEHIGCHTEAEYGAARAQLAAAQADLNLARKAYQARWDADPAWTVAEMMAGAVSAYDAEHERFKSRGGELDRLEAALREAQAREAVLTKALRDSTARTATLENQRATMVLLVEEMDSAAQEVIQAPGYEPLRTDRWRGQPSYWMGRLKAGLAYPFEGEAEYSPEAALASPSAAAAELLRRVEGAEAEVATASDRVEGDWARLTLRAEDAEADRDRWLGRVKELEAELQALRDRR